MADAGTDGATTDDASGEGGAGCAAANVKLCDDFEGVAPNAAGSAWTFVMNGGYTIAVDTTVAHSGKNSVHANFGAAGGYAYMSETKTFPATDWWGRAWMRFMAPGGGHQVFAGAVSMTPFTQQGEMMRYLNDNGGNTFSMNIRSTDKVANSTAAIPVGMWNCYEWHHTATAATIYIDGKMVLAVQGAGWNGLASTYVAMVLGAERFGGGKTGDVWIDDVAVGSAQIGCN
jgi:hypothetical protein